MECISNNLELSGCLSQQTLVITANAYNNSQLINQWINRTDGFVQISPSCYDYLTYIRKLFFELNRQKLTTHPQLLTSSQTHLIWQDILLQTTQFFPNKGLIEALEKAWSLCHLWNIPVNETFYANEQTEHFFHWYQQFKKQLAKFSAITLAEVIPYLIHQAIKVNQTKIIWYGFSDFTWQQQQLQQHFANQNIPSYRFEGSSEGQIHTLTADDAYQEQQQLIYWIKKQRSANKKVTVVVPKLEKNIHHYKRLIRNHFPENDFYINHLTSLDEFPLIAHGLTWLGLDHCSLSNQTAKLLLFSPYLKGASQEFSNRLEIMNHLMFQELELDYYYFSKILTATAPVLADLLVNLPPYPASAPISVWVKLFKNRLSYLGFPGEYALSYDNKKICQRFFELLEEFCQITVLKKSVSLEDCLASLQSLAQSLKFQSKQLSNPIQIISLSESLGVVTDSLWVVGLTNEILPMTRGFSPFIPIFLQKIHVYSDLPLSAEWQSAKYLIKQLSCSALEVVYSYSKINSDNISQLPCGLIIDYPTLLTVDFPSTPTNNLEIFQESYCYPLTNTQSLLGGTALLSNQAKCPFRAFARHRLHATSRVTINQGISLQERGQLLHKMLERLWLMLKSQQRLQAMETQELIQQLDVIIEQTCQKLLGHRQISLEAGIYDLEKARFKHLIEALLAWEKTREPFEIEALEKNYTLTLGTLDFQVRIDRVDKIADNFCIIDYKNRPPSELPWYQVRPFETQLLMYALSEPKAETLLFACLASDNFQCSGLANPGYDSKFVKKAQRPWRELFQQWRENLTALAEEFRQGQCLPIPTKAAICTRCDYQTLCRLHMNA